jgi:hypothetical protein
MVAEVNFHSKRHWAIKGFPLQQDQVWAELDSLGYEWLKNESWKDAVNSGSELMIYAQEFEYTREEY